MAEQTRDLSLSDRESTSDESDCSLVTVQPCTTDPQKAEQKPPKKAKILLPSKAGRRQREKEAGTPSDIGASNEENEVVELLTSEKGVETTKTPAKNPSEQKGAPKKP